ncbi:MAG: hypothetical protein HQL63_05430 [Magnetococcales bacterium]|nr:hypothetical protein [Magnetococcales bacterium]MBF0322901.1 hypothetical protein [Magnetococcales bacterium]
MWSLTPGATCQLRLLGRPTATAWPCRLVRTERSGVGVEILNDATHFLGECDISRKVMTCQ